eukprot:218479_1
MSSGSTTPNSYSSSASSYQSVGISKLTLKNKLVIDTSSIANPFATITNHELTPLTPLTPQSKSIPQSYNSIPPSITQSRSMQYINSNPPSLHINRNSNSSSSTSQMYNNNTSLSLPLSQSHSNSSMFNNNSITHSNYYSEGHMTNYPTHKHSVNNKNNHSLSNNNHLLNNTNLCNINTQQQLPQLPQMPNINQINDMQFMTMFSKLPKHVTSPKFDLHIQTLNYKPTFIEHQHKNSSRKLLVSHHRLDCSCAGNHFIASSNGYFNPQRLLDTWNSKTHQAILLHLNRRELIYCCGKSWGRNQLMDVDGSLDDHLYVHRM